jgi:hypothetical protein
MGYKVYPTPTFTQSFKKLHKKYPTLKTDLQKLVALLSDQPETGIHLGHGVFKIRLAISAKTKGKSGGARVNTYMITEDKEVYLVFIYDKSQLENISKEQILDMLKRAGLL